MTGRLADAILGACRGRGRRAGRRRWSPVSASPRRRGARHAATGRRRRGRSGTTDRRDASAAPADLPGSPGAPLRRLLRSARPRSGEWRAVRRDRDGVHQERGPRSVPAAGRSALDAGASEGRLVADVPADIARSPDGFSYYAVLRSRTSGAATTLPEGGPFAPMRSRPLADAGRRQPRRRTSSAVRGAVGASRSRRVGCRRRPGRARTGSRAAADRRASFDVGAAGVVSLLDEANHRVLRFAPGAAGPTSLPLGIRGTDRRPRRRRRRLADRARDGG